MQSFLAAVLAVTVLTSAGLAGTASSKPPDPALARKVAALVAQLKDPDPKVRAAAAEAIASEAASRLPRGRPSGPLGEPFTAAVAPLIAALQDREAEVRRNAVEALRHIGDPRAVQPLIDRLRDRDAAVRCVAAGAMGGLALRGVRTDGAVDLLAAAMKDGEAWLGRDCAEWVTARSLGMIGGPRATHALLAAAKDPSPQMRRNALDGLGWLARVGTSDGRVKEALLAALKDADTSVRRSVAETLAWLGDRRAVRPLLAMMKAGDDRTRRNAVSSLHRLLLGPRTRFADPLKPTADEIVCHNLMIRKVDRIALADKPLKDVLSYIGSQARIPLHARWRRLEAIGVKPEAKVTVDLSNVAMGAALWHVLAQVDPSDRVGCRIRDGILTVSTEADLQAAAAPDVGKVPRAEPQVQALLRELLKRRVDLNFEKASVQDVLRYLREIVGGFNVVVDWKALKAAGVEPGSSVMLKLEHVRVETVLRFLLDEVAGTGKLGFSVADGVLFISTAANLRAYAARDWRKAPGADTPKGRPVMDVLKQPMDLDFENVSVRNLLRYLSEVHALKIVVDWAALEKAGCSASAPVTMKVRGVPTGRVLMLVLDLAYGRGKVAFSVEEGYVHVKPAAALGLPMP